MIVSLTKAEDVSLVGNKAFSLFNLMKGGFDVPSGFVISPSEAENEIKEYIEKCCDENKVYAVRSSSNLEDTKNYSYAGLFETFLGVKKKDLLEKIERVRDVSKDRKLLEFCKVSKKSLSDIQIAVIVQEMIDAEVAGVCFTKNPVSEKNEIIIEAGIGLGELVVQGEINPDLYQVSKKNFKILKKRVFAQHVKLDLREGKVPIFSYKQKLSDKRISELAKIAKKVSDSVGFECDIEWALESKCLYLLQVRPITNG